MRPPPASRAEAQSRARSHRARSAFQARTGDSAAAEGLLPERSLTDAGMAVLVRAAGVETVIEVDGAQARKADYAVKLREHPVEVPGDVIARVAYVAGVETDAELFAELDAVDDRAQLLKAPTDLGALARHRLEQDGRLLLRAEDGVERVRNLGNSGVRALSGVAAGVEVIEVSRQIFHPREVIGERLARELARAIVLRAGVDGVRRVRHDRAEALRRQQRAQRRRVRGVDGLGAGAARVAGEKLERRRADAPRRLAHSEKTARGGQVTSDRKHDKAPFFTA